MLTGRDGKRRRRAESTWHPTNWDGRPAFGCPTVRFVDRTRWLPASATALGVALLIDVLRVFLPSVITVFGQAADTPAELLGAFALAWFVLPLGVPALARRVGPGPVVLVGAVALGVARVALQFAGGGRPQLWIGAGGVLAGLVWLTAVAVRGAGARGVLLGLAVSAVEHAALGTLDLAWRGGVLPAAAVLLAVAAFLAGSLAEPRDAVDGPAGGRMWAVLLPGLLLWGAIGGSPALVTTAVSYLAGSGGVSSSAGVSGAAGTLAVKGLVAFAVAVFTLAALSPARPAVRWPAAVALVLGAGLGVAGPPQSLAAAVPLVAFGLGGCLAAAAAGPTLTPARRGYALAAGGIAMAVAAILHYSAYDLGYDNRLVFVLVAAGIAAVALTGRPARVPVGPGWRAAAGPAAAGLGVVVLVLADG